MKPFLAFALAMAVGPVLPAVALTPAQWREDLDFAEKVLLERDRSFDAAARERLRLALARLRDEVATLAESQIVAGLAKAVALSGNAHTRLYLLRNRTAWRRYPVRVWWFEEGLHVVAAGPGHAELLGARIVAIGGHPVEEAARAVEPLFAGNDSWRRYKSPYSLTSPDALIGVGLLAGDGSVELRYVDRHGRHGTRRLEPRSLSPSQRPVENWWSLAPGLEVPGGPWEHALRCAGPLPAYLREPGIALAMERLEGGATLYLRYNRSSPLPSLEALAEIAKRYTREAEAPSTRRLVVDLRFNTGGDLGLARAFFDRVARIARARDIPVHVITGRATFSAGLYHAMQLRERASARLAGEHPGDELDFWAEGGNADLPNSRLTLHYADRFHSYSRSPRPEADPWRMREAELGVGSAKPDVERPMRYADYAGCRDATLDAILADSP